LQQNDVKSIKKALNGFILQLDNGETVNATQVILAIGITHFTHKPEFLDGISEEYATHTLNHSDLSGFKGVRVAVIGAGASAVDMAARLSVAGAKVELIARSASISFHDPSEEPRPLLQRIKNPRSSLGLGWPSKISADMPFIFYSLPQKFRFKVVEKHLGPAPGWFVRKLVEGQFPQHMSSEINNVRVEDKQVHIEISSKKTGEKKTIVVDHLIAGTGFRVDVNRLQMLDKELVRQISVIENTPVLSRNFESSVRGLYFTGLAASNCFGPPFRFACGAEYTAKKLRKHMA
jgi:thioredoxin reductase